MKCSVCNNNIMFSYIVPEHPFVVENEYILKTKESHINHLDYKPYLKFYCSNDKNHDIDIDDIVNWSIKIEAIFYEKVLPYL